MKGRAKSYQLPVLRAGGHDMYNSFVRGEKNTNAWLAVKEYYGISDTFPEQNLYTRSENAKVISYVNSNLAAMCMNFEEHPERKLKIVNAGLRIFEKSREKASARMNGGKGSGMACPYRLNHEALHLLEPFITKRKLNCTLNDIETSK